MCILSKRFSIKKDLVNKLEPEDARPVVTVVVGKYSKQKKNFFQKSK